VACPHTSRGGGKVPGGGVRSRRRARGPSRCGRAASQRRSAASPACRCSTHATTRLLLTTRRGGCGCVGAGRGATPRPVALLRQFAYARGRPAGARPAARRCLCCQLPLACPVGVDAGPLGSYPCPTWTVDEPADDDPTERRAIERRGGLRLSARRWIWGAAAMACGWNEGGGGGRGKLNRVSGVDERHWIGDLRT